MTKRAIGATIKSAEVLLLGALWASESVLGKITLDKGFSAFAFPLIINVGSVLFSAICFVKSPRVFRVSRIAWRTLSVLSLIALTLTFTPYLVIYISLRYLSPYETSLISSLTPVVSLTLSVTFFRKRIGVRSIIAVSLGFVGVALLLLPVLNDVRVDRRSVWYGVMLVVPLSYALCGYFLRAAATRNIPSMHLLLVSNLISGALFVVLEGGIPSVTLGNEGWIFMLGVAVNILAMLVMYRLARDVSPFVLSFSNYSTVLFSFVFSSLYWRDAIPSTIVIPSVCILLSALSVGYARNEERDYDCT